MEVIDFEKIVKKAKEKDSNVIEVLIEDNLEINEKTKKELAEARKEVREGKVISHEEVGKRL